MSKKKKIAKKNTKQLYMEKRKATASIVSDRRETPLKEDIAGTRQITVKNAEGDPDTTATILIQNQIDYVPKVSVIIPVYNVEQYLRECLDSVINQTLKEIEIICVDDGSTDSSLEILKEYAQKDKRMTIITQKNLHAGVARNAGLSQARGEYLSFLDSDDFFELNMLEEMYKKAKDVDAVVIVCQCRTIDSVTGEISDQKLNFSLRQDLLPQKEVFSAYDVQKNIFQIYQGWAWDKLFNAQFIRKNKLKFQNLQNTNDAQFTFTAVCLAHFMTTVRQRLVTKRHLHKTSLTANRSKFPDCFVAVIDQIEKNLKRYHLLSQMKTSFWNWALSLCIIQLKKLDNSAKEKLFPV